MLGCNATEERIGKSGWIPLFGRQGPSMGHSTMGKLVEMVVQIQKESTTVMR